MRYRRPREETPNPFKASGKIGFVMVEAIIHAARQPSQIAFRFRDYRDTWFPCVLCEDPKVRTPVGKVQVRVKAPPWGLRASWWVWPNEVRIFIGHEGKGNKRLIALTDFRPKVKLDA